MVTKKQLLDLVEQIKQQIENRDYCEATSDDEFMLVYDNILTNIKQDIEKLGL